AFTQEAVARMDRGAAVLDGRGDELVNVEISAWARSAQRDRAIRGPHAKRAGVVLRVNRDTLEAELRGPARHSDRDLAAIGDEQPDSFRPCGHGVYLSPTRRPLRAVGVRLARTGRPQGAIAHSCARHPGFSTCSPGPGSSLFDWGDDNNSCPRRMRRASSPAASPRRVRPAKRRTRLDGYSSAEGGTPAVTPPSITMVWPVMKPLAFEARKTAAPAISSGSPIRLSGLSLTRCFRSFGSDQSAFAKSVLTSPGTMQLARPRRAPPSTALLRASCMSAALEMQ